MKKFQALSILLFDSMESLQNIGSDVCGNNKALNTNDNLRKIDGNPRISIWDFNPNDNSRQFDRIASSRGGTLLKHRSTGNCLNSHYLPNGGLVNTWTCSAADPDQRFRVDRHLHVSIGNYNLTKRCEVVSLRLTNRCLNVYYRLWNRVKVNFYPCAPNYEDLGQNFNIESLSNGDVQTRVSNTNLCIDSPTRDNGGKANLWECGGNANQRWKINTQPPQSPQSPSSSGHIFLPFKSRQTWYVCQGYNGSHSHQKPFALSLSSGSEFDWTVCLIQGQDYSKRRCNVSSVVKGILVNIRHRFVQSRVSHMIRFGSEFVCDLVYSETTNSQYSRAIG